MASGETVVVGMSGGVDSAVAAGLLKERGAHVVGVTMRLWTDPSGDPRSGGCCLLAGVQDARETCAALRAPDRPRTGWGPGISEPPDGVLPREGFAAYVVAFVEADTCSFERWRADRGVNETGEYYCPTCLATVDCEVGTPMDSWGDPCRCAFDVPCYYRP